jgi:LemA protein
MLLFLIIIVVIALWVVAMYNGLVVLRNRIENAWSQIDVQLKRRTDLIPNLVETVKGYAKHEKEVFTRVTEARAALMNAQGVQDQAQAVAENYPELKANQNFMMLQEELAGTESKIAYARQFYNDTVLKYDNKREKFPSNIIANMFGFKEREYFEVEEGERKPVKVNFSS